MLRTVTAAPHLRDFKKTRCSRPQIALKLHRNCIRLHLRFGVAAQSQEKSPRQMREKLHEKLQV